MMLQFFVSDWDDSTYENRLEYAMRSRHDAYSMDIQKRISQRWRQKVMQCWFSFEQVFRDVEFHFEARQYSCILDMKLSRTLLPLPPQIFDDHYRDGFRQIWTSSLKSSPGTTRKKH
jgi:hypothetical protein